MTSRASSEGAHDLLPPRYGRRLVRLGAGLDDDGSREPDALVATLKYSSSVTVDSSTTSATDSRLLPARLDVLERRPTAMRLVRARLFAEAGAVKRHCARGARCRPSPSHTCFHVRGEGRERTELRSELGPCRSRLGRAASAPSRALDERVPCCGTASAPRSPRDGEAERQNIRRAGVLVSDEWMLS